MVLTGDRNEREEDKAGKPVTYAKTRKLPLHRDAPSLHILLRTQTNGRAVLRALNTGPFRGNDEKILEYSYNLNFIPLVSSPWANLSQQGRRQSRSPNKKPIIMTYYVSPERQPTTSKLNALKPPRSPPRFFVSHSIGLKRHTERKPSNCTLIETTAMLMKPPAFSPRFNPPMKS